MADGIALQGLELVLDWLPKAVFYGRDQDARERMLIAAAMGATAFQKGLGMIHSLAHPLSSCYNMHHGLANALLLPAGISFIEDAALNTDQRKQINRVRSLFQNRGKTGSLSDCCRRFVENLGINLGLSGHGVPEEDLEALSREAFEDPCHQTNMVFVDRRDLLSVYREAL